MLKSAILGVSMLGIMPEKLLFSKNIPVSCVKLLTANGIFPVKVFDERSKRINRVRLSRLGGNSELSWLFWR